ncbi:uncharacterized protein V3H82_014030 [Fundulus diaphanus]
MPRRDFILRCKNVFNDCIRRVEMNNGPEVRNVVMLRLEAIQRSLQWARGRWVNETSADRTLTDLAELMELIRTSSHSAQQDSYGFEAPVVTSGSRGRPSYSITREQMTFLRSCGFRASQMAAAMNVSVRTVKRRLRQFQLRRAYADLSEAALDELVQQIVGGNDLIGPESVRASLRSQGIKIQRRRVRESMIRINPRGVALRGLSNRPQRRCYRVAGPNSLWHIDGNHKLIRWRIVIHGGVDGYSRLIVFLQASNNNRSSTVLNAFLQAIARYGPPSRVRTDRGGENNSVCVLMNIFRGRERGSALRGRSTHNQRIERLWRDLWRGMTNVYYDFFYFLESEGIIDIDNELHIWALHYVYLPRINKDLKHFMGTWNHHGLRTEHHMTPLQLFVSGCLQQQRRQTTAMEDFLEQAKVDRSLQQMLCQLWKFLPQQIWHPSDIPPHLEHMIICWTGLKESLCHLLTVHCQKS